jgi:hypothetical protein
VWIRQLVGSVQNKNPERRLEQPTVVERQGSPNVGMLFANPAFESPGTPILPNLKKDRHRKRSAGGDKRKSFRRNRS